MQKFLTRLVCILIAGIAPFSVCITRGQTTPASFASVRSVVYFEPRYESVTAESLAKDIASIKQAGFNAIYLNYGWNRFESQISPVTYNNAEYARLKGVLDLLKMNGMKAFLGFNPLPPPGGVGSIYTWLTEPGVYDAFRAYVEYSLEQIQSWGDADTAYVFVLTENALPYSSLLQDPVGSASIIRQTLGNIPNQINAATRQAFKFGYHDNMLINLGLVTSSQNSPIASPNPFDFLSMAAYPVLTGYEFPKQSNQAYPDVSSYDAELTARANRFASLYPATPLLIAETGYPSCAQMGGEAQQDAAVKTLLSFALANGYGFSLWSWGADMQDFALAQPCSEISYGLLRPDATAKPSYTTVENLLNPSHAAPTVALPAFPAKAYDAQWIARNVPAYMQPGSAATVSFSFKNTGTESWTSGSFSSGLLVRLGSRIPWDASVWGIQRSDLNGAEVIAPSQTKTFTFPITAPTTIGEYYLQWRMVREGVEWFGESSPINIVHVSTSIPAPTPTPSPSVFPSGCTDPSFSPWPTGWAHPCPVLMTSSPTVQRTGSLTITLTPQTSSAAYTYKTLYIFDPSWNCPGKFATSQGNWCPLTLPGTLDTTGNYLQVNTGSTLTLASSMLQNLSLGPHYLASWDWTWNQAANCYKSPENICASQNPQGYRLQVVEVR